MKVPCEVYSRVSGYLRPVNQWNKGKQAEFTDRKMLKFGGDKSASGLNPKVESDTDS